MTYTKFVDIFHGSGAVNLPAGDDLVKSWYPFKGMCGNTSPAAMLPFGKYMVSPYSGGYSAGYGINKLNCGEPIRFLGDELRLVGFSHFQLSGTGAVGFYYNYAVVTPYYGEKAVDYGAAHGRPPRSQHESGQYSLQWTSRSHFPSVFLDTNQ